MRVAARGPLGRALDEDRDGLVVDHLLDLVAQRHARSLRRDAELVDGAVGERRGERTVDEPVLLDEREAVERGALDRDVEVVAAAGPVDDVDRSRRGTPRARSARIVSIAIGDDANDVGRLAFLAQLPERLVRTVAARSAARCTRRSSSRCRASCRRSRLYEATAKNLLRVTIELVGGVAPRAPVEDEIEPEPGAARGAQGRGQRRRARLDRGVRLLAALGARRRGRRHARLARLPRRVRRGARARASRCPRARRPARSTSCSPRSRASPGRARGSSTSRRSSSPRSGQSLDRHPPGRDVAPDPGRARRASSTGCARRRGRERASLLEVSVGIGLAFFNSARQVGRQHVLDPYAEDLAPVRDEGLGAYARRVSRPYAEAVARHFDAEAPTLTERGLETAAPRDDGEPEADVCSVCMRRKQIYLDDASERWLKRLRRCGRGAPTGLAHPGGRDARLPRERRTALDEDPLEQLTASSRTSHGARLRRRRAA